MSAGGPEPAAAAHPVDSAAQPATDPCLVLRPGQIAAFVGSLRRLDLRQSPSVTQTLEWARTLLALGVQDLDAGLAAGSLPVLLAYRSDIELAAAELGLSD